MPLVSSPTDLFDRDPTVITHPDVEGPPLTDELVSAAERILDVKLPDSYVELMRECNGGYLTHSVFPTNQPTSWAADHVSVTSILGIAPPTGDEESEPPGYGNGVLSTPYMTREWGLPEGLVLLDGDGHTWVALDYRGAGVDGEPSVVWIDVELDEELDLAPTFSDLVSGLLTEDDLPLGEA
jgi:hypothetical protein